MMADAHDNLSQTTQAAAAKLVSPREVRLEDLLHGERELLIRHGEEVYHLRITKNGRLLLTK